MHDIFIVVSVSQLESEAPFCLSFKLCHPASCSTDWHSAVWEKKVRAVFTPSLLYGWWFDFLIHSNSNHRKAIIFSLYLWWPWILTAPPNVKNPKKWYPVLFNQHVFGNYFLASCFFGNNHVIKLKGADGEEASNKVSVMRGTSQVMKT